MSTPPQTKNHKKGQSLFMKNTPSGFAQFRLLLAKDLRQEFRTREMLTSMGLYAFLVLIVLGVAFTQVNDLRAISNLAGGLVWVIIVFA